jgi:hypothetical protein
LVSTKNSRLEWLAHAFAASFAVLAVPTLVVIFLSLSMTPLVVMCGALTAGGAHRPDKYGG